MTKASEDRAFSHGPLIAVLRADAAEAYQRVVEVLVASGIRAIELTLTTPGTFDVFESLRQTVPSDVSLGVGTVTSVSDVERSISCGADFLVSPNTDLTVIASAVSNSIPIYPGGLTPSELFSAAKAGAAAVKLFPAGTVGSDYVSALHGPFPALRVIPSGGIGIDDIPAWLDAGASAVSLGGPLIGDAFRGGDLAGLRERADRAITAATTSAGYLR